jgi:hypothetical protein
VEVAQVSVADQHRPGPFHQIQEGRVVAEVGVVLHAARPVGAGGAQLVGVDGRVGLDLGHARRQLEQSPLDGPLGADPPGALPEYGHEVVGEDGALLGRQLAEREPDEPLGGLAGKAQWQPEIEGQLEVDVEELRPAQEGADVAVDVLTSKPQ